MPVETADDLAGFFNPDEFGDLGAYIAAAGGTADVKGLFDDPFLSVALGVSVPVADASPTFLCRSADLPAAAAGGDAGDALTIGDRSFRVAELRPDGTGLTLLVLAAI